MKSGTSFILVFTITIVGCNKKAVSINDINSNDIYLLENSSQRLKDKNKYFSHEYAQINNRRKTQSSDNVKPDNLVGLAFSGGGIRSSAYQLGLLSGLYKKKALGNIDYISSVSGGSWANGAYWAWASSDEDFFNCLNKAAKQGVKKAHCKSAKILNNKQRFALVPLSDKNEVEARKLLWRNFIEQTYLPDCNVNAEDIKKNGINNICLQNYKNKPYIIINASHSIVNQGASEKNMPFQFTPDSFGMLSDCYPGNCKEKKDGFFVKSLSTDFQWINNALFRKDEPGSSLSNALAVSSGVVAGVMLLSYEYELLTNNRISIIGNYRGDNIKEIREEIVLSDGGKSDNLGLVPLIERGVDLIIISYMGKDKDLNNNPWEDLDISIKQAKNLLSCTVHAPNKLVDLKNTFIYSTSYECENNTGKILHLKASYDNSKHFIKYLKENNYDDLVNYLNTTDMQNSPKDRFPQTETMKRIYDEELIRAYYLFGQWIAEEHLVKKLKNI